MIEKFLAKLRFELRTSHYKIQCATKRAIQVGSFLNVRVLCFFIFYKKWPEKCITSALYPSMILDSETHKQKRIWQNTKLNQRKKSSVHKVTKISAIHNVNQIHPYQNVLHVLFAYFHLPVRKLFLRKE